MVRKKTIRRNTNIALHKKDGVWGIKNIFSLGKALAGKNMWRCFMILGLSGSEKVRKARLVHQIFGEL
jgi:hypothetical protein